MLYVLCSMVYTCEETGGERTEEEGPELAKLAGVEEHDARPSDKSDECVCAIGALLVCWIDHNEGMHPGKRERGVRKDRVGFLLIQ